MLQILHVMCNHVYEIETNNQFKINNTHIDLHDNNIGNSSKYFRRMQVLSSYRNGVSHIPKK